MYSYGCSEDLHPLYPSRQLNLDSTPCAKWSLVSLENTKQWVKVGSEPQGQPLFSPPDVPIFTAKEYEDALVDPNWTLEETVRLIELSSIYNLNFCIITDRLNGSRMNGSDSYGSRDMESVKDRYYSVCRSIIKLRNVDGADTDAFSYDKERDVERRLHLESLYARTLDQMAEETFLMSKQADVRRNFGFLNNERERIIGLLNGSLFASTLYPYFKAKRKAKQASKKNEKSPKLDTKKKTLPTRGSDTKIAPQKVPEQLYSPQDKDPRKPTIPAVIHVSLRSQKANTSKMGFARYIEKAFIDYGIPLKPQLATERMIEKYDELKAVVSDMVSKKRKLEK